MTPDVRCRCIHWRPGYCCRDPEPVEPRRIDDDDADAPPPIREPDDLAA